RVVHLPGERLLERARDVDAAIQVDLVAADEGGREEREALDMIPVDVAEEHPGLEGHLPEQLLPEEAEAGAPVQDDQRVASADLVAARVAAELHGAGAGRGDAAANSPHLDPHSTLALPTLPVQRSAIRLRQEPASSPPRVEAIYGGPR